MKIVQMMQHDRVVLEILELTSHELDLCVIEESMEVLQDSNFGFRFDSTIS